MNGLFSVKKVVVLRTIIQYGFLLWLLWIGIRFGLFVRYMESGGTTLFVPRSPGVEGFLPIGALASLKYWLVTGIIHPVHPAALVIFLAVVLMSLLTKKSFCSLICPAGTLSEGVYKLGACIFGRNFQIWPWLDLTLRSIKYLLLLLFVKLILLDMSGEALADFLNAPYWAMSDIKMLRFFTSMSVTTVAVLAIITGLSFLYRNFWCRYVCPYGGLLGLTSMLSPFKIRRDAAGCSGCQRCTSTCPASLPVHSKKVIRSAECNGCLTCVSSCPEKNVLRMAPPIRRKVLPLWSFPALALFIFGTVISIGMITGNWHGSLTTADYRHLIPLVPFLRH